MSLIVKQLQTNIVSRGLGVSTETSTEDTGVISYDIPLEQNITTEEEHYPLTGIYAEVDGWKWNKSLTQALSNIRQRIETSVGGYKHNLEEGTINSDWYGSVLSGLKLNKIYEFQDKTKRVGWRPVVEPGVYSVFHKEKRLASKAAISTILSADLALADSVLDNSISITLFKRDSKYNNIPYLQYSYNEALTDTYAFYIEDSVLKTSTVFELPVGSSQTDIDSIKASSEYMGYGRESRTILYPEFFPCIGVTVYTVKEGTLYSWSKVDSFSASSETDRHFKVDSLGGRIMFPQKSLQKQFIVKQDQGNRVHFYNDLKDLPISGHLTINDQTIEYFDRSKHAIYLASDRQPIFIAGDTLLQAQKGQHLSEAEDIYINYTAVPRIDYESLNENFEDKAINLKPCKKANSNGILELNIDELNVNAVVISCDKPKILDNIFGELFIGSDTSIITAEALNANSKPVKEVQVEFIAREGEFDNSKHSTSKTTNLSGKCFAGYHYPYSDNALRSGIIQPKQIGNDSYFEVDNIPPGTLPEDIVVFQTLKTDPFYPGLGREYSVTGMQSEAVGLTRIILGEPVVDAEDYNTMYTQAFNADKGQPTSKSEISDSLCLENYYNHGLAVLNYGTGIKRKTIIRHAESMQLIVDDATLSTAYAFPESISLFKRGELEFKNLQQLQSIRTHDRVLYSFVESESEYRPITATRILGSRIYFDDLVIPAGGNESSNIIAGYKIFYPQLVGIKAQAINPANGMQIISNEIKLKVTFPLYLRGALGFKFLEEDNDEGSALGGTNFITINPTIPNTINIIV